MLVWRGTEPGPETRKAYAESDPNTTLLRVVDFAPLWLPSKSYKVNSLE